MRRARTKSRTTSQSHLVQVYLFDREAYLSTLDSYWSDLESSHVLHWMKGATTRPGRRGLEKSPCDVIAPAGSGKRAPILSNATSVLGIPQTAIRSRGPLFNHALCLQHRIISPEDCLFSLSLFPAFLKVSPLQAENKRGFGPFFLHAQTFDWEKFGGIIDGVSLPNEIRLGFIMGIVISTFRQLLFFFF
ncbi:hypothetical protein CEXT_61571 [Caerostris extrusa]|uniref:Uncharacterized protein n=1 Tax=Caerostris extrusa TaxID=172846 RepID=A0AAV4TFG7_CAEEX|nr:hypothetical protein CEXT_61571 [Caerostris extrusa]